MIFILVLIFAALVVIAVAVGSVATQMAETRKTLASAADDLQADRDMHFEDDPIQDGIEFADFASRSYK